MFKTIFSKLIALFIALLIISFSITGAMLFYFLDNFVAEEKEKVLIQIGEDINNFMNESVEYLSNPERTLRYLLKVYMDNTNAQIWIVNTDGYIEITQKELPELAIPADVLSRLKVEGPGHVRLPDERQYKKVMQSTEIYKEQGDFYGLFKNTGKPWLIIAKPLVYRGEIQGAIYLLAPMPKIQEARTRVFRLFMMAVSIAVLISVILAYVFSRRLSKPLKQMNSMAKVIAGGDFRKRVDIETEDEIGELAKSFNQMVTALQNLEEMRRGFIANVSHELRTPMTSIRGFIEGILDGTIPPERQKEYLTIVRDETHRLNRLVNDLLDLARMESGEITLILREFNINELIRRCIIKLESFIIEKNLQIEAGFQQEELYVAADADAIERVVINLIHNAVKFTEEGGKITLSTWKQKGKVFVSVEDTGVGIDKNEISMIWDRFYKSDKSRSKDKTGTGLGLAIVKNIINEHKQEIKIESELGEGTKFTFTLNSANKETYES